MDEQEHKDVAETISPDGTPIKERRRSRTNSRVHFPEDLHDSDIISSPEHNSMVDVNLGWLQTHHVYEAQFSISDSIEGSVISNCEMSDVIKSVEAFPKQDGSGHDVVLQLVSFKDGVLTETFQLISKSNSESSVTVAIHSRILGKDQGTPLLKDGVRCIGIEQNNEDADSECSDSSLME